MTPRHVSARPTVVFIHGAWVTPRCWDPFKGFFEARGYKTLAPAWPGKDRTVAEIRQDPSPLAGLGIAEIVEHYAGIIRGLPEPPFLVGHSFGGLVTQILLDRGLGRAAVAIDPAPPKGVFAYEPTSFLALGSVLLTWRGWQHVVRWSFARFRYAFVHSLPPEQQRAAYDTHVTPETGRVFFEAALADLLRHGPTRVDFGNARRAPLLIIAGADDRIVPARVVRRNHRKYRAAGTVTDFREFPGRTHWIIAQDGWEEVAGFAAGWLEAHAPGPEAPPANAARPA
ncbi:MAG: alpha/beta hydrolase [Candidatus Limnocylindrales bacterium]